MSIDWFDQHRVHSMRFEMVSPTNLEQPMGELTGVERNGSSLMAAYYTDLRTSGRLKLHGLQWDRRSFIRITHLLPDEGYSRVLGTYIVTSYDNHREKGEWVQELELQSILYGLQTDIASTPWALSAGADAVTAMTQMLSKRGRPYRLVDPNRSACSDSVVYKSGETYLTRVFDLCEISGNRVDVDPRGYVTIGRHVNPHVKVPMFELDLANDRGIVHDGVSMANNWLEIPTEAAVVYRYSEQQDVDDGEGGTTKESVQLEIDGEAFVLDDHIYWYGYRGYHVVKYREISDMEPATQQQADKLAYDDLTDCWERVEWTLTTQYLPIWEGDVVILNVPDGPQGYTGRRKCMVKSLDLDLGTMQMNLTLKETTEGRDEE